MRYNVKKKEKQVAVPGDANYIVPEDRVPLKEKICYGIGGLMDGGGVALMSCILVKYMTTMGIPMKIATTIFICEVVGRNNRPNDGLYQRQHARQMGQTQAVYVCGRHFDYRVDIPAVYACERLGRFDKRIYRVYADNVFIMEHLFYVVAGSVLFDVKRHIPVLP